VGLRRPFDVLRAGVLVALVVVVWFVPAAASGGSTLTVTNTNDTGAGSLRQALLDANSSPGSTIEFNIPESDGGYNATGGWFTIAPTSPLPQITASGTTIDGTSQTAFTGDTNPNGPEIFLDGRSQVSGGPSLPGGLWIPSSSNIIEGLTVSGFAGQEIVISGGDGTIVRGDYVGSDPTGTSAIVPPVDARAFEDDAIWVVDGATNTVIGGTTAAARNVISGNQGSGILVSSPDAGVTIEGNYIGTNAAGSAALANTGGGIAVGPEGNWANQPPPTGVTIGGTAAGAGNVISANGGGFGSGIGIAANQVTIQGNLIGTDATGTQAIPNGNDGVDLYSVWGTLIGGSTAAARNVISGNSLGVGVSLSDNSDDNVVQGNYIGTSASGSSALGNDRGVQVEGDNSPADNNTIVGNTISGNDDAGVFVGPGAPGTTIRGNLIGTDASGTAALGNGFVTADCCGNGVRVNDGAADVTVGGATAADRNVISGNNNAGVGVVGATRITIRGNYLGTDITGTSAIPNGFDGGGGVEFYGNVTQSTVRGNVLSGNTSQGIGLTGVSGNTVVGNWIGTAADGTTPLPNGGLGVYIDGADANQNMFRSNTIAFNTNAGIGDGGGTQNTFSRNSIFSNGGPGITLGDNLSPNDPGDTDTGPNNLQNYPVLTSALVSSGHLVVKGTIDTPSPATVTLEFFANAVPTPGGDPSGYGEGAVYLGSTYPAANGTFTASLPSAASGTLISATATDAAGNTSEFALDIAVGTPPAKPTISSFTPSKGPAGTTVTINGSGFSGASAVKVGTAAAQSFTVNSEIEITATVAAGTHSGKVTVVAPTGIATSTASFTMIAIGAFAPASGIVGSQVTITGSGFTGATAVAFNGTPAQSYSVVSDSVIKAVVAAGTTTGPVSVTTPDGAATSSKSFTLKPSIGSFTPLKGPVGTSVTINGSGFTGATAVKFGTTNAQSYTVNSDIKITATVAAGTHSGKITVVAPGGTATSATAFTMVAISSFTPTHGKVGTHVTILGSGFTGATAVTFNGTNAQSYTVVSDTKITAVVAAATTTGTISVTTPNGDATSAASFTVT
jgi:hypothetical protein